ncbi:hypothetical protein COT60_04025 [Candidatus Pacearchaeota archaeon CG09_land_8_20_14_0_10_30_9]|nr:hypothetical protein [Candidatus Pacearchaeota archaeon]OIO40917.1 MAG: hypothetical protein AUJ61_00890 [Candidatus Pacearchaeota archaeon CG1_02_30_18]PIN71597.1 MAG: hypothetical protein COV77_01075 [Candidatus Pacearchaeota archaeon CG11_big_fil_rev_8_21_14_0_20_30_13]PIO00762.1 MAG: hypothetical protein COT60_04025 [Candidatus Pacearchaeota archaeon CG09_land_8_20_14_0_10_30_9]PIZ81659.1 MAG: hypothetical protein COX98_03150 [Candidatus Pacearchaeota archaeon CG_4_10_14_0_2_um_filter_30
MKKKSRVKKIVVPAKKKSYKKEGRNILIGFLGFILTLFAVQLSYNGPGEALTLNITRAVEFLSSQINYLIVLSRIVPIGFGIILLIIPSIFFYVLSKKIFDKKD